MAVAASIVPLLATYAGERAAQHVGHAIGQAATTSLARIYEGVKAKVTSKPSAQDALRSLEHKPEDGRRRMALEVQLEELIRSDPSFGEALQRLAEDARGEGGVVLTQVIDTGAVAIQGNVYQQGTNVAGRDLTLGSMAHGVTMSKGDKEGPVLARRCRPGTALRLFFMRGSRLKTASDPYTAFTVRVTTTLPTTGFSSLPWLVVGIAMVVGGLLLRRLAEPGPCAGKPGGGRRGGRLSRARRCW